MTEKENSLPVYEIMKKILFVFFNIVFAAVTITAQNSGSQLSKNQNPETVKFVASDIVLFWKAYDLAKPENNLNVFRDEYLRKGSEGLEEFRKLRIGSSCGLVDAIEKQPRYYAALREPSLKIASYENEMRANFRKLKKLYSEAVFPDVYFLIGRMNSAGTLNEKGLFIGVDMFGKNENAPLDELGDWHKAVVSSSARLPFVVVHESLHYQQKFSDAEQTLLSKALIEGGADFIAQIIAGNKFDPYMHEYGNAHEKELWQEFQKEMSGKDITNWLYQGDKAKDRPADLGYYMGYKICEEYYKNAKDKRQAVKDILEVKNSKAFLETSRYEENFKTP